ncbi:MAG: recombinase family protein [Candidatus Limnocylindrales bacterium]
MARWYVYVRRSWKEANAADVSDEQQEASARALIPPGAIVEVISDSGGHNSGRTEARDGYRELIAAVRAGKVDGIAVYDLSRLARNARLMLNLRDELDRHQVALAVATMPNTRFDTAIGRYLFGQLCLTAQFQADMDSERMSGMLHRTFEDGRHRGHDPYGYRSERDAYGQLVHPRQLVPVPEEAEVVRRIWRELEHRSIRGRAPPAQRRGHPYPRGPRLDPRRGQGRLAARPRVSGYVVEKRGLDERPGHHEPILDEETYRATLAAVRARTHAGNKPRPFRDYPLRGVLFCSCGSRMRGEARVQRGGERRYYRCPRAGQQIVQLVDGKPAVCHERLVPADAAEKTVLDAISRGVLPADVIEAARDELRQRLAVPHDSLTGRQRARLKQRLEQLRKQHEWADITDEDYRARRAETLEELALLPDSDKLVAFDRNRRIMTSMAANVNAATPAQQAELVQMLVERVVASGGKVSERDITWTPPARPFFAEAGEERWWECPQGDSNP